MKLITAILLFCALSCDTLEKQNHSTIAINKNDALLSSTKDSLNGFSYQSPVNWQLVDQGVDSIRVYFDKLDSGIMLVNAQTPDLSQFQPPQSSSFYNQGIKFSQDVYQNNTLLVFKLNAEKNTKELSFYFILPRDKVETLSKFVESSIASFSFYE